MNEPVDLTGIHAGYLRLHAPPTSEDAYRTHYHNLCRKHRPAIAAIIAHEDLNGHRFGGHPMWLEVG